MFKRATLILILAFSLITAFSGCGQTPPKVGEPPPKVTLSDLAGESVTLPDHFKGRVVLIRFWVDWCATCAREMPSLDTIFHKYKDKGFIIFAINIGQSRDIAEAFATKLKISYPVLLDPSSHVTKRYGVTVVPTTFIVDKRGVIKNKILGEIGNEALEKMILELL